MRKWFFWGVIFFAFVFYEMMMGYSKFICHEIFAMQYSNDIAFVVEKIDKGEGGKALAIIEKMYEYNIERRCPEVDFSGMLLGALSYILSPHGSMVSDEDRKKELNYLKGVAEKSIVIENK